MIPSSEKPRIELTVFSDYICPFCYVGSTRLDHLREYYTLRVHWRFLEIHPDNPHEGRPVSALGYPPAQWEQMMANLTRMAAQEGLQLAERTFTTNSHKALMLADAIQQRGDEAAFYALHKRLFEAFFCARLNIGDIRVLQDLAAELGISRAFLTQAWEDAGVEARLRANRTSAARIGISGVPAFIIGKRVLAGAVPTAVLIAAARECITPA